MDTNYLNNRRHSSLSLARAYHDMSYIFRHYVQNVSASRYSLLISWAYSLGLDGLAQSLHSNLLRPVVRPHEWALLTAYGKKHGVI